MATLSFEDVRSTFSPDNQLISLEAFQALTLDELKELFTISNLSIAQRGNARLFHPSHIGKLLLVMNKIIIIIIIIIIVNEFS